MKAILSLIAASLAAFALAVSAAAADRYVPGVTDFPSTGQVERYVPGVTDFPSRAQESRDGGLAGYVPGVTDFPSYAPESPAPGAEVYVTDGFDWLDAGFGAAVGLALGAMAAAALLALRRRTGLSAA
jgi:opacity protein-like surface antigen